MDPKAMMLWYGLSVVFLALAVVNELFPLPEPTPRWRGWTLLLVTAALLCWGIVWFWGAYKAV